jgi:signal transduction histidine kinase
MYWFGVYLIFAAVVLRALVWYRVSPYFSLVVVFLVIYGLLLSFESLVERRIKSYQEQLLTWFQIGYLVIQTSLIVGILIIPPLNDFGGMLFIPISLQAVLFFQRRVGFFFISLFTLVMGVILLRGGENFPNGLAMALLFGGICFLAGSYAHLIFLAQETQRDNQRTLGELQAAHRQLQSYSIELEQLAADRERIRLARDMHDSVTQTVFSMNLTVQSARLLLNRDRQLLKGQLDRLQDLAREAMNEIQVLITHLQPAPIAEQGFVDVVKRLILEKRRLDDLQVSLEYSKEMNLPKLEIDCLTKIVQEALTNIVKHAETQQAIIRINLEKKPLFLEIEDHGSGFTSTTDSSQSEHLGLKGMSERASEIGWRLSVDSQPGRGTLIRVEESATEI